METISKMKISFQSDGSESLNFCEFRNAISDKTSFQNDLLSSSLKRAMIIDRMDSNKMNFPPEACDDGLPQDFMVTSQCFSSLVASSKDPLWPFLPATFQIPELPAPSECRDWPQTLKLASLTPLDAPRSRLSNAFRIKIVQKTSGLRKMNKGKISPIHVTLQSWIACNAFSQLIYFTYMKSCWKTFSFLSRVGL